MRLNVPTRIGDSPAQEVSVHDLSVSGMLLESDAELAVGEAIAVELPEAPAALAQVVWSSGRFYGCQFDRPIPGAAVSASLLQSPFDRAEAAAAVPDDSPASGELPYAVERGSLPTALRIQAVVALSLLLWAFTFWLLGIV